jgi:transcriptional regulator with XRE-family HTH domain
MGTIDEAIRKAIESSELTPFEIARRAGIARSQLSRFLSGERGLSVATVEQLAECLGLEITIKPKRKTKKS